MVGREDCKRVVHGDGPYGGEGKGMVWETDRSRMSEIQSSQDRRGSFGGPTVLH